MGTKLNLAVGLLAVILFAARTYLTAAIDYQKRITDDRVCQFVRVGRGMASPIGQCPDVVGLKGPHLPLSNPGVYR